MQTDASIRVDLSEESPDELVVRGKDGRCTFLSRRMTGPGHPAWDRAVLVQSWRRAIEEVARFPGEMEDIGASVEAGEDPQVAGQFIREHACSLQWLSDHLREISEALAWPGWQELLGAAKAKAEME